MVQLPAAVSAYVKAVYHAKMEKLEDCFRPGAQGNNVELRWEDFEAALLRDNFWQEHPMPHEQHLHLPTSVLVLMLVLQKPKPKRSRW